MTKLHFLTALLLGVGLAHCNSNGVEGSDAATNPDVRTALDGGALDATADAGAPASDVRDSGAANDASDAGAASADVLDATADAIASPADASDAGAASTDVLDATADAIAPPADASDVGVDGAAGGMASCSGMDEGFQYCVDYSGPMAQDEARSICTHDGTVIGTIASVLCPTAGRLGGCRIGDGAEAQVFWLYSGTEAQLRMRCSNSGGVFLSP